LHPELLFSSGIVFVEGPTDEAVFNAVALTSPAFPPWRTFSCSGKKYVVKWLLAAQRLSVPRIGVVDSDFIFENLPANHSKDSRISSLEDSRFNYVGNGGHCILHLGQIRLSKSAHKLLQIHQTNAQDTITLEKLLLGPEFYACFSKIFLHPEVLRKWKTWLRNRPEHLPQYDSDTIRSITACIHSLGTDHQCTASSRRTLEAVVEEIKYVSDLHMLVGMNQSLSVEHLLILAREYVKYDGKIFALGAAYCFAALIQRYVSDPAYLPSVGAFTAFRCIRSSFPTLSGIEVLKKISDPCFLFQTNVAVADGCPVAQEGVFWFIQRYLLSVHRLQVWPLWVADIEGLFISKANFRPGSICSCTLTRSFSAYCDSLAAHLDFKSVPTYSARSEISNLITEAAKFSSVSGDLLLLGNILARCKEKLKSFLLSADLVHFFERDGRPLALFIVSLLLDLSSMATATKEYPVWCVWIDHSRLIYGCLVESWSQVIA